MLRCRQECLQSHSQISQMSRHTSSMLNNALHLLLLACFSLSPAACSGDDDIEVDPLALPEGIVTCQDHPQFQSKVKPGHFSALRDGEPLQGVAKLVERPNGLWRLDLAILHPGCFSTLTCSITHFPLKAPQRLTDFPFLLNQCATGTGGLPPDLDWDSVNLISLLDVEDDVFFNNYYNDTLKTESYLNITELNLDKAYIRGTFHLVLSLDTSCASFRSYPASTELTDGVFVASLNYY